MAITKQASSMVMVEMVTMMTVSFRPIDMSREAGIYLVLGASAAIDTLQAHGLLYRSANRRREASVTHSALLIKGLIRQLNYGQPEIIGALDHG